MKQTESGFLGNLFSWKREAKLSKNKQTALPGLDSQLFASCKNADWEYWAEIWQG